MWNMSVNDNLCCWFIQNPLHSCCACLNLQSHITKWCRTLFPIKQRVVPNTVVSTLRVHVKQFGSRTVSHFLSWLSRAIRSECLSAFCLINKSFPTTEEHVSSTNRLLWLVVAHAQRVCDENTTCRFFYWHLSHNNTHTHSQEAVQLPTTPPPHLRKNVHWINTCIFFTFQAAFSWQTSCVWADVHQTNPHMLLSAAVCFQSRFRCSFRRLVQELRQH